MTPGYPGVQAARPPGSQPVVDALADTFAIQLQYAERPVENVPTSLYDILAISLISIRIMPHLPITSLLALASTNHLYQNLVLRHTGMSSSFRYLDLSPVKCASIAAGSIDIGGQSWRAERMDEALTEDDFYSGPLRGIFNRLHRNDWLYNVSTLVLDGLTVPTEIVREILMDERFNVRILSIRDVKQLNQRRLCQALKYVVRPCRPQGTPKLRGLYVFGPKDPSPNKEEEPVGRKRSPTRFPDSRPSDTVRAVGVNLGEEWNRRSQETLAKELGDSDDKWYHSAGKLIGRTPHSEWAETLMACEGIIHFDAVLCRGPRHNPTSTPGGYLHPAVATIALGPTGCSKCKTCPEGPAKFGESPSYQLPLLAPPPFNSISIRAAQIPSSSHLQDPRMVVRCAECMRGRWCERCHKWWCESCYDPAASTERPFDGDLYTDSSHHPHGIKVYKDLCTQSCTPTINIRGERQEDGPLHFSDHVRNWT